MELRAAYRLGGRERERETLRCVFVLTGKQRGIISSESDTKLASTGLTEKQLQLSVEV